jgi:septal ring factor EnvC (AmiA/AmiB activator)
MFDVLLPLIVGALAGFIVVSHQNKKQEELDKLREEDEKLEDQQQAIQVQKAEVKQELNTLDTKEIRVLSDSEIEEFWNKERK